jgi:hypothetical protein
MSLDFAILGPDGAPEKSVSLGIDVHHELIAAAAIAKLARFECFADYYEDAEVGVDDLPDLVEQIRMLRLHAGSTELHRFLDDLGNLAANAVAQRKVLYAIAD